MKKNQIIIYAIIAGVIIAGGSFYGGTLFEKSQKKVTGFPGGQTNVSIRGNRQGGAGVTSGEILSKDDKSITIKLPTGGSKIILFSNKTEIGKFTTGTTTDLEVGKTVMVQGQAGSDGSIVAQSIQLRPIGTFGPAGQTQPTK